MKIYFSSLTSGPKSSYFAKYICWHSPQPPRQAPITICDTSCCRQRWVCFPNVTQILNKTSNNSTPQGAAFHCSSTISFHPVWFHIQLVAGGGVRTRSRTSASWHQTQVELGYTGCRSSAPGSVLSALASEYTRSLTKNPFGAHFLHQRLLLYQQPFAQPCTGLMWRSLSPRTEISVTPVNHMESPYSHQRRHETAEIVQPWNVRKLVLKVTNPGSASSVHCSILSLSYILSD